jgi:hypothetical protein
MSHGVPFWQDMKDHMKQWGRDFEGRGALEHLGPEYTDAFLNFQFACNSAAYDPQTPLVCITDKFYYGGPDGNLAPTVYVDTKDNSVDVVFPGTNKPTGSTYLAFGAPEYDNGLVIYDYLVRKRIENVCPGQSDNVWPLFYQNYDSPDGKKAIDDYFAKNPEPPGGKCYETLKQNMTEYSQRRYMRLNAPDWETQPVANPNFWSWGAWWEHPQLDDYPEEALLSKTLADTVYDGHYWGNPFWSHTDREEALRLAVGVDSVTGQNFQDVWAQKYVNYGLIQGGKSAEDYFSPEDGAGKSNPVTDPKYSGNLPYLVPYLNKGTEPWHDLTTGKEAHGYNNPCNNRGFIETYLPVFAGVVGGAFCGFLIPGKSAKVTAAVTGGTFCYEYLKGIYGVAALERLVGASDIDTKATAADILSIGGPITLFLAGFELQLYPEQYLTKNAEVAGVAIAGAAGYLLLAPALRPLLNYGGDVVTIVTAPLTALELGFTWAFNGCFAHILGSDDNTCFCEDANDKELLIRAFDEVMGTTGAQSQLRKQCFAAAMTTGTWGSDPHDIEPCDGNGHTATIIPCMTAGTWLYSDESNLTLDKARKMKREIAHCADPNNRSMLPPTDQDQACVKQYGEYFRWDDSSKSCKDFRAPLGQQDPGYKWPTDPSNDSCTIL